MASVPSDPVAAHVPRRSSSRTSGWYCRLVGGSPSLLGIAGAEGEILARRGLVHEGVFDCVGLRLTAAALLMLV
jgi:hypothetical protein